MKMEEINIKLPGFSKKDVIVKVENGMVEIHAEKKNESEIKKKNFYSLEKNYSNFSRSFPLPVGVEDVHAEFQGDILKLKFEKKKKKVITVK